MLYHIYIYIYLTRMYISVLVSRFFDYSLLQDIVNELCVCVRSVAQLCLTLCDPMDCSPPGSTVHGISQAKILEWIAISSPWGIFLTQVSNACLLCLLYWQVDSLPLCHLGSPKFELCYQKIEYYNMLWIQSLRVCKVSQPYQGWSLILDTPPPGSPASPQS